jgi:hypothetical protein
VNAVARATVLHLRTVAPYRTQGLLVLGVLLAVLARNPAGVVPSLALLLAPLVAVHPFVVAEKEGLDTLHAVLPVPRRAVLLGHYAWSLACFLTLAAPGAALSVALAHAEHTPYTPRTLATVLTSPGSSSPSPSPSSCPSSSASATPAPASSRPPSPRP